MSPVQYLAGHAKLIAVIAGVTLALFLALLAWVRMLLGRGRGSRSRSAVPHSIAHDGRAPRRADDGQGDDASGTPNL